MRTPANIFECLYDLRWCRTQSHECVSEHAYFAAKSVIAQCIALTLLPKLTVKFLPTVMPGIMAADAVV